MKSMLLSVALFACTALSLADGPEPPDPCFAPPSGATPSQLECYEKECDRYKKAIADCNGDQTCLDLAEAIYNARLVNCTPTVMETSEGLVVWRDGDEWRVAWPGDEYPAAADRFAFNI